MSFTQKPLAGSQPFSLQPHGTFNAPSLTQTALTAMPRFARTAFSWSSNHAPGARYRTERTHGATSQGESSMVVDLVTHLGISIVRHVRIENLAVFPRYHQGLKQELERGSEQNQSESDTHTLTYVHKRLRKSTAQESRLS